MPHTPRRNVALCAVVFVVVIAPALPSVAGAAAQTGVEHREAREAFTSSSAGPTTIDFGADLRTQQPYAPTVEVTATTSDGRTQAVIVSTRDRPASSFVGFISDRPIITASFRSPKGQSGPLLDNITYGRKAEARAVRASTPAAREQASQATAPVTPTPTATPSVVAPTPTAQASRPSSSAGQSPRGTIAYTRGGTEIRLIEADGRDDRRPLTAASEDQGGSTLVHDQPS